MIQIGNITSEAIQRHTIIAEFGEIVLTLRYYGVTESWFMDVEYKEDSIRGVKLSLAAQHINSKNWPFDFIVNDSSGLDVDPFLLTGFEDDRCQLYMLEPADLKLIRGYDVEL